MDEKLSLAYYSLARDIGERVGLDDDDVSELASRALILSQMPGVDPVAHQLWGRRIKGENQEHPLVRNYGGTMSDKGGVVTAKYSWRLGPRYLLTQDNIGPAKIANSRVNIEGDHFDLERAVEDNLDVLDERTIRKQISELAVVYGLFLNREQLIKAAERKALVSARFTGDGLWSTMVWDFAAMAEQTQLLNDLRKLRSEEPVSEFVEGEPLSDFDRRDVFAERLAEIYPRDTTMELDWGDGAIIRGESYDAARKASGTRSDYIHVQWEQNDVDKLVEGMMCEGEEERNRANGGNGTAVYLDPEYPHDDNYVQSLLDIVRFPDPLPRDGMIEQLAKDRKERNQTFQWIASDVQTGDRALRRLVELANGLSADAKLNIARRIAKAKPKEKAELKRQLVDGQGLSSPTERIAFFREVVAEFVRHMSVQPEQIEGVEDEWVYYLYDLAGIDLSDDDSAFYDETRWLNLDSLSMPVDELEDAVVEGKIVERRKMPDKAEALDLLTSDIDAVPGNAPWHTAAARREEYRVAASTRCSWDYATKRANKAAPRLRREVQRKVELVVQGLRRDGLVFANGEQLTWNELADADVVFGERDAAKRLKVAILTKIDQPDAIAFAERLS